MEAWVFLLCFSHCWTFLFGPVNSPVVLGGLWSDFRNRNHLSEAKWRLRDVVVVMRGWRCWRRKWWNHWKNSSKGCIYSCVRAKWDGTSTGHFGVYLNVTGISLSLHTCTKNVFLTDICINICQRHWSGVLCSTFTDKKGAKETLGQMYKGKSARETFSLDHYWSHMTSIIRLCPCIIVWLQHFARWPVNGLCQNTSLDPNSQQAEQDKFKDLLTQKLNSQVKTNTSPREGKPQHGQGQTSKS